MDRSPFSAQPESHTKIELTDLRSITRNSDRGRGVVLLHSYRASDAKTWLVFGEGNVRQSHWRDFQTHTLTARMTVGVRDREGDSAYALQLTLIGLSSPEIIDGITLMRGWIDPNESAEFRVPRPGYDPTKMPETRVIGPRDAVPTIVVPDQYWLPPFDLALFKAVRGRPVELRFGTVEPGRDINLNWKHAG